MESTLKLTLVQSLIKKDKFEWVLQKAVELGVNEIIPVITERTQIHFDEKKERRKLLRWERIVSESAKQCGRDVIPEIQSPVQLRKVLLNRSDHFNIVFDEHAESAPGDLWSELTREACTCAVFIGPEGGWGSSDREHFKNSEAMFVKLGPRILRAETAAITALTVLQYEFGDLRAFSTRRIDTTVT
jgi:16S rRNA (uracil1498-N3)-methyltransferase